MCLPRRPAAAASPGPDRLEVPASSARELAARAPLCALPALLQWSRTRARGGRCGPVPVSPDEGKEAKGLAAASQGAAPASGRSRPGTGLLVVRLLAVSLPFSPGRRPSPGLVQRFPPELPEVKSITS